MLPHVGDIDIMSHFNSQLAIPRGHPPPTQLPADFHDYVKVYEIIDSQHSGYVYLELRNLLTKCTDSGRYNDIEYQERGNYLSKTTEREFQKHGQAHLHVPSTHMQDLSWDYVLCVRCLQWPPQAAGWPTRHRSHGWPDSATVDRVVNNGCDMVHVAHRQCRQDEWMNKVLWRLSFSRAEIVLINSWMPVQQIVYHLLRVITKTVKLTENADNSPVGKLSNYHIKTLMLWACELKRKRWWTDDLSLIRICIELLHTLAVWLTEAQCSHYFLSTCNLVDKSFALEMIGCRLFLIDKECILSWFVNNYIRQSVQICPRHALRLFDDVSTKTKLENAVSAVVDWRRNIKTVESMLWPAFCTAEYETVYRISGSAWDERSWVSLITELSTVDMHLSVYFTAVVFLHVANKIERSRFREKLAKALAVTTSTFVDSTKYCNEQTFSLLNEVNALVRKYEQLAVNSTDNSISELVELLQQSAVKLLTTYRQLQAQELGSIVTIVTTDFEALYAYKRGDYRRCLQMSTQNVRMLLYADCIHNVSAFLEFIQFLDDDIVSLTALTLSVNPECRHDNRYGSITQLTLSLYLMTHCQLKFRKSLTSLALTLDYIEVARRRHDVRFVLNQLTLKMTERKLMTYKLITT